MKDEAWDEDARPEPISKRYGILRQMGETQVWSAWVGYEDQPSEGKYRPVLVIDVNDRQATRTHPFTSDNATDEYDIEVFDWHDIPLDYFTITSSIHYDLI